MEWYVVPVDCGYTVDDADRLECSRAEHAAEWFAEEWDEMWSEEEA